MPLRSPDSRRRLLCDDIFHGDAHVPQKEAAALPAWKISVIPICKNAQSAAYRDLFLHFSGFPAPVFLKKLYKEEFSGENIDSRFSAPKGRKEF